MIYLDASALVKLVVEEPESAALAAVLSRAPRGLTSAIVEVEVPRAVRRVAPELAASAAGVLARIDLVEPGRSVRARAATLDPDALRSLDAIHLATALEARDELTGFLTYDLRLAAAAAEHGFEVLAPA